MSDRPNCMCGHSYGQHAWGTGFCSGHDMLPIENSEIRQPKWCDCKNYKEGLCPCGHAWEAHGFKDTSRMLVCPVCGKECLPWQTHALKAGGKPVNDMARAKEYCICGDKRLSHFNGYGTCTRDGCDCMYFDSKGKPVNQPTPVDSVCTCEHYQISHINDKRSCCIGTCPCTSFTPKIPPLLACKHCIFQAIDNNTIKHSSACKLYSEATETRTGERQTSITWPDGVETSRANFDLRQNWQRELDEEEKEKPDCHCSHPYSSHYDEKDKLPCAECWGPLDSDHWETSCKDYTPKKQLDLEYSDDPTKVNEAALQAIGNTGSMTSEEIQARIDQWKSQQLLKTGTVPKQPVGYNYGASSDYNGVWAKCWHKPVHVINGRTWGVWAGTKNDCMSTALNYDILLNVSNGYNVVPQHDIPFKWAEKYQRTQTKEIMLDWPDQDKPIINPMFWKDLVKQLEDNRQKMLIFCIGGHGRTGTSIACLLVALGWTALEAKEWVWKNYCKEAIETKVQEDYIDEVEKALNNSNKPRKRVKKVKELKASPENEQKPEQK